MRRHISSSTDLINKRFVVLCLAKVRSSCVPTRFVFRCFDVEVMVYDTCFVTRSVLCVMCVLSLIYVASDLGMVLLCKFPQSHRFAHSPVGPVIQSRTAAARVQEWHTIVPWFALAIFHVVAVHVVVASACESAYYDHDRSHA